MAMEYRRSINEAHATPITDIKFNPFRREIFTGAEGNTNNVLKKKKKKKLNI